MILNKSRLEAFSDGVLAIILTIMVLELRVPVHAAHAAELADLKPLWPVFSCYAMSFVYVGIYWANHHHMFHATRGVTGGILWANLHLLFWLSLIPFVTGWMGENSFAPVPTAAYGVVLLLSGAAYRILQATIVRAHKGDSVLARAVGRDYKGLISVVIYALAIPLAFYDRAIAGSLYALVAIMWLVPDRRIERVLTSEQHSG